MPKLRRFVATCTALTAVAAGGLGLSACTAGLGNDAAQVNSYSISRGQLTDVLSAIDANSGFRCVITGGGSSATKGAGDSYSAAFAAEMLTTLVEERALDVQLGRQHLVLDDFARSLGLSELEQALAPGGSSDQSCTTPAATILAELPASTRDHFVNLQAAQDVLAARSVGVPLTQAGVGAWASAHPSEATLSCLDVAAFSSTSAAASFQRSVSGGASFATAAAAAGTQPESGCLSAATLPAPLPSVIGSLSVNNVSSPVSYNGGYLVVELTSRRLASGTEAAGLLMNVTASKVSAIVDAALAGVQVSVDPTYGSWKKVSATYQVVPPKSPPTGLLLNPSAVEPSTGLAAS